MKINKISTVAILSIALFAGCSVVPHANITDSNMGKIDYSNVDFSKKMKHSTICVNPHKLDGDLTIMKAAKKGGISKVLYVTKSNHFTTQRGPFLNKIIKYTQKCITVYGN